MIINQSNTVNPNKLNDKSVKISWWVKKTSTNQIHKHVLFIYSLSISSMATFAHRSMETPITSSSLAISRALPPTPMGTDSDLFRCQVLHFTISNLEDIFRRQCVTVFFMTAWSNSLWACKTHRSTSPRLATHLVGAKIFRCSAGVVLWRWVQLINQ